ncbi:hypothetical protein [uncultured Paludibaculum sp.]|uniref:hypothetical protein n=1 Tax=uncultured Paludibaculum sp. TaxID=1765020 RepID=UPI002AABA430|nr:hypothetical protein [uncultured Paludibaculum sp.]
MRKHTTTYDAMAAAALARGIQHTDANWNLHAAAAVGVASHEDSAPFHNRHQAFLEEFRTLSLHEQILTASSAAATRAANQGR